MITLYCLKDPRDMRPYYVGSTKDTYRRRRQHIYTKYGTNNPAKEQRLAELVAVGLRPVFEEICFSNDAAKMLKLEEQVTLDLRAEGFEILSGKNGSKPTEEVAEKIASKQRGVRKPQALTDKMKATHIRIGHREKTAPLLRAANEKRKIKIKDDLGNEFESIHAASRFHNIPRPSIKAVLTGRHAQAHGRKFIYA